MKLLESRKFKLPILYLVWNKATIKELPIGVPFVYADESLEEKFIRFLEYEFLFQAALKTGYPFDFKKILADNGYTDTKSYWYHHPAKLFYITEELHKDSLDFTDDTGKLVDYTSTLFNEFVKDSSAYVDVSKLKELNVFPVWMDVIEKAIETNIHNFSVFNNNMYNKKLEGMYGAIELTSPKRNLIIIDISGSIPKAVSSTCLLLAKNLSEAFFADLMITGSKSTLYAYENLHELNVQTIYAENGMDNDQTYFKKLVTEQEKHYETAIVFGDNHSPSYAWRNDFNKRTRTISQEDGKKMCKWKIKKLISFHTKTVKDIAGYADWFTVESTEKIADWCKYLN